MNIGNETSDDVEAEESSEISWILSSETSRYGEATDASSSVMIYNLM